MTTKLKRLYIAAGVVLALVVTAVIIFPQETLNDYEILYTITIPPLIAWLYWQIIKEPNNRLE